MNGDFGDRDPLVLEVDHSAPKLAAPPSPADVPFRPCELHGPHMPQAKRWWEAGGALGTLTWQAVLR